MSATMWSDMWWRVSCDVSNEQKVAGIECNRKLVDVPQITEVHSMHNVRCTLQFSGGELDCGAFICVRYYSHVTILMLVTDKLELLLTSRPYSQGLGQLSTCLLH